jgi:hypothetical protein
VSEPGVAAGRENALGRGALVGAFCSRRPVAFGGAFDGR